MATSVIIGFGTTVGGAFSGACATSVNWGYNPNIQRLYCLGTTTPWKNVEKPTETYSITIYEGSGGPGSVSVEASTACDDLQTITASVSPASCGGVVGDVSGSWYLNSYSYSKGDPNLTGQETWSLQRWVAGSNPSESPVPNHYIQGASEGQASEQSGAGIVFVGTILTGNQGSVSAGGTGQASITYHGTVSSVGSAVTLAGGDIGTSSASMPITPLWTT
jgi:hypothetical protein